ncbi:MAG: hypothetical protein LBK58_06490 [Prevotellaceae bacterium]|jgi:hypothetical protein|nr:hypothetical protein [Prevotellaceae bacterium]
MGSVTGGDTYAIGATPKISATANAGHRFVQWHDVNTDNPRDITVTQDASYTAIFEATAVITIKVR